MSPYRKIALLLLVFTLFASCFAAFYSANDYFRERGLTNYGRRYRRYGMNDLDWVNNDYDDPVIRTNRMAQYNYPTFDSNNEDNGWRDTKRPEGDFQERKRLKNRVNLYPLDKVGQVTPGERDRGFSRILRINRFNVGNQYMVSFPAILLSLFLSTLFYNTYY